MTKLLVERTATTAKPAEADGSYPIVLITPGQGTSGYYHESVIRSDAPKAFPKGTHVYLDHLREGEERTPEKLLGTLTEDTTVNEQGEAVNRFKPLKKHAEWVEEVRPFVGFSVAVQGDGRKGEVDGRQTLIVESLSPSRTNTVDLVSYAGRGGRFLESFLQEANATVEDARTQAEPSDGTTKGNESTMTDITKEQFDALKASVDGLVASLTESKQEAEKKLTAEEDRAAVVEAIAAVESADVSEETKAALREQVKTGNYDVAGTIEREQKLRESLREELKTQILTEAGASAGGASGAAATDYTIEGW